MSRDLPESYETQIADLHAEIDDLEEKRRLKRRRIQISLLDALVSRPELKVPRLPKSRPFPVREFEDEPESLARRVAETESALLGPSVRIDSSIRDRGEWRVRGTHASSARRFTVSMKTQGERILELDASFDKSDETVELARLCERITWYVGVSRARAFFRHNST